MSKYDRMVSLNRKNSEEKTALACKTIFMILYESNKTSVPS